MRTFYRTAIALGLFLAVMLVIAGTAAADTTEKYETTATIQETGEDIPDPYIVVPDPYIVVSDPIYVDISDPIYVLPVAKIQCSYLEIRSTGTTVYLKDISERATERNWDFGDGVTSTEQNPVHTYLTRGTYTITLTVSNVFGTNSATETIDVCGQIVPPAPPAA